MQKGAFTGYYWVCFWCVVVFFVIYFDTYRSSDLISRPKIESLYTKRLTSTSGPTSWYTDEQNVDRLPTVLMKERISCISSRLAVIEPYNAGSATAAFFRQNFDVGDASAPFSLSDYLLYTFCFTPYNMRHKTSYNIRRQFSSYVLIHGIVCRQLLLRQ